MRTRLDNSTRFWLGLGLLLGIGCGDGGATDLAEGPGAPRAGLGDGEEGGGGSQNGALPPGTFLGTTDSAGLPAMGPAAGESAAAGAPAESSAADADPAVPFEGEGELVQITPEPGVLTAGAWDDNRNYLRFTAYREALVEQQLPGLLPIDAEEFDDAHARFEGAREANERLDIALVIDATGSMGDEIAYLQTEFTAISQAIEAKYPEAEQRWSLVVYRDDGDLYKVRWFDFRDSAEAFREKLAEQGAGGGGDFPEAPDAALSIMNQLAWRDGETTARLAFWVADAPHHDENADAMAEALRDAQRLDIHLYPVASSGIMDLSELTMRSAAQLTGGRYLFLTDDSGVGGAHKEPSIPCYFVTKLDDAIRRMVDIELSGRYREPDADQILRTGGNPEDGACTSEGGEALYVF